MEEIAGKKYEHCGVYVKQDKEHRCPKQVESKKSLLVNILG